MQRRVGEGGWLLRTGSILYGMDSKKRDVADTLFTDLSFRTEKKPCVKWPPLLCCKERKKERKAQVACGEMACLLLWYSAKVFKDSE